MFWNKPEPQLLADGARVGCPARATDVDIEACMACPKLLRIVDDDPPYVVCSAWRPDPYASHLVV